MPLETNLEKDTKVVQHEQKKFLQQHKVRMESYQKAVSTMKKQRKKKATPENTEKELRVSGCICIPYMNINDLKSHRKKKKKKLTYFPTEPPIARGSEEKAGCVLRSELQECEFIGCRPYLDPPIRGKEFCT